MGGIVYKVFCLHLEGLCGLPRGSGSISVFVGGIRAWEPGEVKEVRKREKGREGDR